MNPFCKAKNKLLSKVENKILSSFYASQRVFLDSIGLRKYDVNYVLGLKTNYAIHYLPELDCVLPKLIKTWYDQIEDPSTRFWTEEDEALWNTIIK